MILTAEGAFFGEVTDLDHEVDQILDWEDLIVQDWVLAVNGLDEGPELVD